MKTAVHMHPMNDLSGDKAVLVPTEHGLADCPTCHHNNGHECLWSGLEKANQMQRQLVIYKSY